MVSSFGHYSSGTFLDGKYPLLPFSFGRIDRTADQSIGVIAILNINFFLISLVGVSLSSHRRLPHLTTKPFDYVPHISIVRILTKGAPALIDLIERKFRHKIIGELSIDQIHIVRAWPYLTVGRIETLKTILI